MSIPIFFFSEDVDFKLLNENQTSSWLHNIIVAEGYQLENINYIFCSDEYLHSINLEHLKHDTFTDIITFDLSEDKLTVCSDIFISIDRVKDNAINSGIEFQDELHRVLVHGLLHLMSYNDKTEEQKTMMRKKEDACLSLRKF